MAFAFGDSYLKLPPITGESAVEIDEKNSKRSSNGAVCDKNRLVRLPPIVRLDSLRSPPSTAQVFPRTPAENESEMSTQGSSLKISHKMDVLRQGSSKRLRKYATEKNEDEIEKLINAPAAKETDEDSEDWSYQVLKPRRFRSKERSRGLQGDYETVALYKDRLTSRRGSATFKNSAKLSRTCRLVKSSPELCSRKINLKYRTSGNVNDDTVTSLTAGLSPGSFSRTSQARLSVHDIDGSVLSHLQNTAKIDEKVTKSGRSLKGGSTYQPLSTPNSPVCSKSANKEYKQKGRKSLNDITETVKQFIDRRRPSISPPKKQNLVDETAGLKIEGKTCPQAEKEIVGEERIPTVSHANSLHPPQHSDKRHSLYDLQQILSLLQIEDLKRQSSSTSSPPQSSSASSNGSDTSKPTNASVYDLREFLKLAVAAETSSGKQIKTPSTNTLNAGKTQGGSSAHLLHPEQEQQNQSDGARKSSIYDLMGFLSLGGDFASASTSENSSRSTSPRPLFSPRSSNELLSVSEPAKARRSSTYDLLEFLSLSRSGANSRPDSGQSSSSLQGDKPKTNNPENEERETDRNSREARSLSVYDLAEYLSMISSVPPFVRVTPSDEEQIQAENRETVLESRGDEKIGAYKRDSVYDLGEMLNIMQREQETKRESMYNLPEILSHIHREASAKSQERETNNESVNSCEEKKDPLASPSPPTVSSGYSSDSPLPITDSNSLQANDNTSSRQMSVYDLREFLSLYAAHQFPPNQQITPSFRRKPSNVSQSGVSIHVTDESNKSLELETDDVFLPVPGADTNSPETRKRSSVYDLAEFLSILNADDSPLRRRLSSVSSSESESESNQSRLKSDTFSAGSKFGANESEAASRPQLSPRQDSGGNVSLYDLGEFLSLLNKDEAPLRRRLSSASDNTTQDDSRAPRNDSEKSPLYSLGEILSVLNDFEQKRVNENVSGESERGLSDEISIPVPLLAPAKNEKTNTQTHSPKNRLTSQKSLTSVPERSEVKTRLSL